MAIIIKTRQFLALLLGAMAAKLTVAEDGLPLKLYDAAHTANRELGCVNKVIGSVMEAQEIAVEGMQLIAEIDATRGKMGKEQAKLYEMDLEAIAGDLDSVEFDGCLAGQGIAGCMSDCADAFPGVGGGNTVNRIVCKAACLVHGGDNGNN